MGTVRPGRGLGATLMAELDAGLIAELFGVPAAIRGTLNVRLERPVEQRDAGWRYAPAAAIAPDWQERTGAAGYFVVPVLIVGRYRGTAFQGDEPDHPADQVELVSDVRLRAALGLTDGDSISFVIASDDASQAGMVSPDEQVRR
jgi:CTP-dependent riboflavin kinase